MSKKKVEKVEKKGLHIPANPKRVKVEQIAQEVTQTKDAPLPQEVTLAMVYEQQKQILEQNAYIVDLLQKRR